MADRNVAKVPMKVSNVSLHRQGKAVTGTLRLTEHHLIFSYYLDAPKAHKTPRSSTSNEPTTVSETPASSREGSGLTQSSASSSANDALASDSAAKQSHKSRPKEVYVPYPLINYCLLRPSPAQGLTGTRTAVREASSRWSEADGNDQFPPTYGTSPYTRASTDSGRLAPYASPQRPVSPARNGDVHSHLSGSSRPPAIRIRCKDFTLLALHFHESEAVDSPDDVARQAFHLIRSRCCIAKLEDLLAFSYSPAAEEKAVADACHYDARREFARMGVSEKAAEGPGAAWRISSINQDHSFSATYPSVLCVPRTVSDNMLKYGGAFRSRSRIPSLSYLHSNGGSITRSSQPMVGVQGKRNPQDERLVSAIFASHTPTVSPDASPIPVSALTSPSSSTLASTSSDATTLQSEIPELPLSQSETALDKLDAETPKVPRKKIYGSSRRNLIVDARPRINALANKATGGGIEDISHYAGNGEVPVEKLFLNIANIHVMRSSLEKVVDSLKNSDYLNLAPDQEVLRKSGWLGHIASVLDGAEIVTRTVGLGGSHVLIHCSDGWDRTAQISSLAQVMLDPYYRTISGIITLIQKDWLSYGHKFHDRNGIEGSEKWFEIENERLAPARGGDANKPNTFDKFSSQALSSARGWFDKNRSSIFRQQNASHDSLGETSDSRPASPPPNPLIHSPPTTKDEKEHKTSDKEISPVFHQFLDALFQLQAHYPEAFEFNERFLRRLLYHAYAGQFGEFLFNNEKDRSRSEGKTSSVWLYFLSRRAEFTNPAYNSDSPDPLLFPKRQGTEKEIEVKWWSTLFGRKDEEMNVPRPVTTDFSTAVSQHSSALSSDDGAGVGEETAEGGSAVNGTIREARSTPSLSTVKDSLSTSFSSLGVRVAEAKASSEDSTPPIRPPIISQDTDAEILNKYAAQTPAAADETGNEADKQAVTREQVQQQTQLNAAGARAGIDFAAFARGSAFSDR